MKRYKLLKDLPTFKAGDLFYISQYGDLIHDGGDIGVMAYARQTLNLFPNILAEWFEEIQEESTDSIHWRPKRGESYWFYSVDGNINFAVWCNSSTDIRRYEMGKVCHTHEECEKARDRRLAEVRLSRTSTFKPGFKNGNGGWIIGYDYYLKELTYDSIDCTDYGEPVRYATYEEAEKSIKENREDWLIYFGIDPSDTDKR